MADRVVHLAGDAGPLGQDGLACQQLPLALRPLGALAQRGQQQGAGAHVDADGAGQDDEDDAAQPAADLVTGGPARPRLGDHHHADDGGRDTQRPARDVPADGVGEQQQEPVQRGGEHREESGDQERHGGNRRRRVRCRTKTTAVRTANPATDTGPRSPVRPPAVTTAAPSRASPTSSQIPRVRRPGQMRARSSMRRSVDRGRPAPGRPIVSASVNFRMTLPRRPRTCALVLRPTR